MLVKVDGVAQGRRGIFLVGREGGFSVCQTDICWRKKGGGGLRRGGHGATAAIDKD